MPVVDVGEVRVLVRQHSMPMRMHVRLAPFPPEVVLVLMVRVMPVAMGVLERFMRVLVLVPLANVQPNAQGHERRRDPEQRGWRLGPQRQRDLYSVLRRALIAH